MTQPNSGNGLGDFGVHLFPALWVVGRTDELRAGIDANVRPGARNFALDASGARSQTEDALRGGSGAGFELQGVEVERLFAGVGDYKGLWRGIGRNKGDAREFGGETGQARVEVARAARIYVGEGLVPQRARGVVTLQL